MDSNICHLQIYLEENILGQPEKSDWWKPTWQDHLLEETVGDAVWEGDTPGCCSGATVRIMLHKLSSGTVTVSCSAHGELLELAMARAVLGERELHWGVWLQARREELFSGNITLGCQSKIVS